jgi:hypothetical protein
MPTQRVLGKPLYTMTIGALVESVLVLLFLPAPLAPPEPARRFVLIFMGNSLSMCENARYSPGLLPGEWLVDAAYGRS